MNPMQHRWMKLKDVATLPLFPILTLVCLSCPYDYMQLNNACSHNVFIILCFFIGKTTMTEKLLLYGGALQQAGAVRMKGEQRATQSDFMEMEKQRGISIRWAICYRYIIILVPIISLSFRYANELSYWQIIWSATVMSFDYNKLHINILDTPGHQDFSEDTYRWVINEYIYIVYW